MLSYIRIIIINNTFMPLTVSIYIFILFSIQMKICPRGLFLRWFVLYIQSINNASRTNSNKWNCKYFACAIEKILNFIIHFIIDRITSSTPCRLSGNNYLHDAYKLFLNNCASPRYPCYCNKSYELFYIKVLIVIFSKYCIWIAFRNIHIRIVHM